jgi:hypothetical protein
MKQFLVLLLLCVSLGVSAQDKIYTTTQRAPIEGEITEVSANEVKYKPVGRPIPIITIDKQDVLKIVYANGQVMVLNDPMKDFTLYANQHRWNGKVNVFSPLNGHTQLFLENVVKPGRSREFELNIIGLGVDPTMLDANINPVTGEPYTYGAKGLGLGYGMRFIRMPDYVNGQVRLRHLMQGSYIKPGVSVSYYTRNFVQNNSYNPTFPGTYGSTVVRKPVFSAAAHVTFGRQWILDNQFSIEVYALLGLGFDNVRSTQTKIIKDAQQPIYYSYQDNTPYNAFGFTRFSKENLGVISGVGLRAGYLFDWKKPKATVKP